MNQITRQQKSQINHAAHDLSLRFYNLAREELTDSLIDRLNRGQTINTAVLQIEAEAIAARHHLGD